jgi:NADH dehydrogenase
VLPKADILNGRVTRVDHASRTAWVLPYEGREFAISYDVLVMAPGSVARTLPIPGLAEHGIGFKTVGEAIYLRNHVLNRLDVAETTDDPQIRRRALTFCVIGGGYAGIECLAELEDMARDAMRFYPSLTPRDMRWVLVEATGRILPEVSESMGVYTVEQLRARNIEVKLSTRVNTMESRHVVLDDGTEFDADTIIWTAGVKPNPMLRDTDLPLDEKGRLKATEFLNVMGVEGAWTAGDSAAVPDITKTPGEFTGPSAQHAVRQAARLGDNIIATLRGQPTRPYKHAYAGSVASLGLHKGVAEIYGIKLRGMPAWWMHRTYHLARVPTLNRKVRVVTDWTISLFFRREIVSLGSLQRPREEWERIALPESSAHAS